MKKKLVYISPECFCDVDFGILHKLNSIYDLYWIMIFPDFNVTKKVNASPEEVMNYAKKHNIKLDIKQRKARIRHPKNIFFNISILKKIYNYKPDIIYIELFPDIYFSLLSSLLFPKHKTIIGIHDVIPHSTIKSQPLFENLSYKIQRLMFRNVQLFSKTQQAIFQEIYPKKKTFIIQMALKSIQGFETTQNRIQKNNKQTIFIFFGFVRYNKGLDYLIQAAELLIEKGITDFKIAIQGNCDDWNYYQKFIKHPDFFEIKNKVIPNCEIPDLFCSGHFLILPYRDITQSGPLFFAFNYNLPIIASDLQGFLEYIEHGKSGLLFRSENIDDLAEVMRTAIEMNDETYQKIKYHQNVFKEINMTTDSVIKGYVQMFGQLS